MNYSNSQILSAVLSNFLQPLVIQLSSSYLKNIPFLNMIENKVKSLGIANPNWSIVNELTPFADAISDNMIEPILSKYISNIPDEAIPAIAHSVVDKAISQGELKLLDGFVTLDNSDLTRLKNLLNWNLPLKHEEEYKVIDNENEGRTDM